MVDSKDNYFRDCLAENAVLKSKLAYVDKQLADMQSKEVSVEIHDVDHSTTAYMPIPGVEPACKRIKIAAESQAAVTRELHQTVKIKTELQEELEDSHELSGQLVRSENDKMSIIDNLKALASQYGAPEHEIRAACC